MLYTNQLKKFSESYKERNLYYKIFAGLIFNELIQDNNLPELFLIKLIEKYEWTCDEFKVNKKQQVIYELNTLVENLKNNQLLVSFDYHINRDVENSDNGEMADIFIGGVDSFIAIEAKFEKNYSFGKDIEKNQARISSASKHYECLGIQVFVFGMILVKQKVSKKLCTH